MESLERVVADWRTLAEPVPGRQPTGATRASLPACAVIEEAAAQSRGVGQEDVCGFFVAGPEGTASPFAKVLLGNDAKTVHFMRFWRAAALAQRLALQQDNPADETDLEPIVEEVIAFRDSILRHVDAGAPITRQWLAKELEGVRRMSADRSAWASLEVSLLRLAPPLSTRSLKIEEVSALMLPWLDALSDDYLRGCRAAKLSCLHDVTGCSKADGCLHLGTRGWDVEAALQSLLVERSPDGRCVGAPAPLKGAWSTHGAKLRKSEVECPICAHEYGGKLRSVTTRCCFQTMCAQCRSQIVEKGGGQFCCPFCRCCEPMPPGFAKRQPLIASRPNYSSAVVGQTLARALTNSQRRGV